MIGSGRIGTRPARIAVLSAAVLVGGVALLISEYGPVPRRSTGPATESPYPPAPTQRRRPSMPVPNKGDSGRVGAGESAHPTTIDGRVALEDGTEAPAEFTTDLRVGARLLATVRTNARGWFSVTLTDGLEPSVGRPLALRLRESPGWELLCGEVKVTDLTGEPVEFLVRRALPPLPLRGIVVDEATGELLPDFMLVIEQGETIEMVRSNGDGEFETQRRFHLGGVGVELIDDEAMPGLRERAGFEIRAGTALGFLELRVASSCSGPTYSLDCSPGVEGLRVGLVPRHGGPDLAVTDGFQPIRPGSRPWVRFRRRGPICCEPYGEPRNWKLAACDAELQWYGESAVPSVTGVCPESIQLPLERHFPVECRTNVSAVLSVSPTGEASATHGLATKSTVPDRPTLFHLRSGDYLLRADARGHKALQSALHVANEPVRVELRLQPFDSQSIAATLTSRSGHFQGRTRVKARALSPPGHEYWAWVHWELLESGSYIGTAEIRPVPRGAYEVVVESYRRGQLSGLITQAEGMRIHHSPDFTAWEPTSQRVEVPSHDLLFTGLDDLPRVDLCAEILDAGSDTPLAGFRVCMRNPVGSFDMLKSSFRSGDCIVHDYPVERVMAWIALSPGYQPRVGSVLEDFTGSGDRWHCRVSAQRGWGCLVRVVDPLHRGVRARISAAGEFLAFTDDCGYALLSAPQAPQNLRVESSGHISEVITDLDELSLVVSLRFSP